MLDSLSRKPNYVFPAAIRSKIRSRAISVACVPCTASLQVAVNLPGDDCIVAARLVELIDGTYACKQARAISRSLSSSHIQTACLDRTNLLEWSSLSLVARYSQLKKKRDWVDEVSACQCEMQ